MPTQVCLDKTYDLDCRGWFLCSSYGDHKWVGSLMRSPPPLEFMHSEDCLREINSSKLQCAVQLATDGSLDTAACTRCKSSTRHYRIVWDGKQFTFGLGKFPSLKALQSHFYNKPIISGDSGTQYLCMHACTCM